MSGGAPEDLSARVARDVSDILARPPSPQTLAAALRHLAKWRAHLLLATLRARSGPRIAAGPFAGMLYEVAAAEGSAPARLLGAYEASLRPVIEAAIARAYPQVLDIGCAEGFYAVGLARRMPATTVLAHDSDPRARALCAALAAANGVADRVRIGGALAPADLALCAAAPTFVLCDIEGGEEALLDPAAAPALAAADLLVETHPGMVPGVTERLAARFAPTHRIARIDRALAPEPLPDWAEALSDLDRLLLLWEWRAAPTPWLWMEARTRP